MQTEASSEPLAQPQATDSSCLVVISCPDAQLVGRRIDVEGSHLVIGRSEEDASILEPGALWIRDPKISAVHTVIRRTREGLQVRDCGSTNGTAVLSSNGERLPTAVLKHGMSLQAGTTLLRVLPSDSPEARSYESLHEQAFRDKLTGLANRRLYDEELKRLLASAARRQAPLSLCIIDVDHFKQVNDEHGHAVGDAALRAVADRLRERLRGTDLLARIGGEEFALALDGASPEQALRIAEDFRKRVEGKSFDLGSVVLPLTVSIGVAHQEATTEMDPTRCAVDLYRQADQGLYEAKRSGRNQVVGS